MVIIAIYSKEEKEKKINKELNKLKRTYNNLPENKQPIADKLIIELAFMSVTLEELKRGINETGVIDEMPQGSYSILRKHPAVKTYNTTIQRYTTLYKQLSELYPKEDLYSNKVNNTPPLIQSQQKLNIVILICSHLSLITTKMKISII